MNTGIGFADAVRKAVAAGDDNWEMQLYQSKRWDPKIQPTVMDTRSRALGPEWLDLQHVIVVMQFPQRWRRMQSRARIIQKAA